MVLHSSHACTVDRRKWDDTHPNNYHRIKGKGALRGEALTRLYDISIFVRYQYSFGLMTRILTFFRSDERILLHVRVRAHKTGRSAE